MTSELRGTSTHEVKNHLTSATALQKDIFRTILYFDIFDHPLSAGELYSFLPSNSTSVAEIAAACSAAPLSSLVSHRDGMFFLARRSSDLLHERKRKEHRARRYWHIAKFMGAIIRLFPFVRGVLVSGELSKGVVAERGDIDFFIVTADRRLWLARSLLILFKKLFLLNSKRFFCLNHFVTENYLEVTERNLYTAMEIATLKSIYNSEFLRKYVNHNRWINDFLPNCSISEIASGWPVVLHLSQKLLEAPFSGRIGDWLDDYLLAFWKRTWNKRYAHIPAEKRNWLFRSEPFLSTAYGGDFLNRILEQYHHSLEACGFAAPTTDD